MHNVLAMILGGGRGSRLFPLTKERSKPAVPLAGKYRLIDIPISNCINSGIDRIFVLTQFLAQSLNQHISTAYRFDPFRREGFVNILAAEQTDMKDQNDWYQGTADAIRKTLRHAETMRFDEFLILSGDHLYRMDYSQMVEEHRERGADVTVAALEVSRDIVPGLGVMDIDLNGQIERFVEKPTEDKVIDSIEIQPKYFELRNEPVRQGLFLANMGVYVFNREVLHDLLSATEDEDFGKEILPHAIQQGMKVYAHQYNEYWEDIGTIRAFFDANLALTDPIPKFNFFDDVDRIYTHGRFLPPSKINGASFSRALLSDGCIADHCDIFHSVIGIRSVIGMSSRLEHVIVMGQDYYPTKEERDSFDTKKIPQMGIGKHCYVRQAIIDKNAHVGDGCKLVGGDKEDQYGDGWTLRDGILCIHKGAVLEPGTELIFG
ncbi:glucose-1-phosphate adenylyltransferase [bacterium]|nr:glucose-1-phosphate adenylyltransferase [bacterium]